MNEIIVDCTELCRFPVRTGIQRCVRELLRNWPENGPELHPARVDPVRGLVRLPSEAIVLLLESDHETRNLPFEEIQQRLVELIDQPVDPPLPSDAPILIPEVFYDPQRSRFHEERLAAHPGSLAMLCYDFLPFLQPNLFGFPSCSPFMSYLRLISMASSVAFISDQTRRDFATRVLRVPADDARIGPVVPLGADGLPVEHQHWRSDRRQFVCMGSLDGRKNQDIVAAAFMHLWESGHDSRLLLIGAKFNPALPLDWLDKVQAFPQFRWLGAASDDDIAGAMREARATIFVSAAEGFGLPPVESLKAGIPVIALADIPSVAMLPQLGQLRLSKPSMEAVSAAVLALEDDSVAERLWAETAQLKLDTWSSFALHVAQWCATLAPAGTCSHKNVTPLLEKKVDRNSLPGHKTEISLSDLRRRVHELPWHHQIDFGNDIVSPGNTKLPQLMAQADVYFKHGIRGKTLLDIGCWDGFNSFEAKKRGADRVLATDHFAWSDQCWGKREAFDLARASLALDIDVLDIDLPELAPERIGRFDFVLFAGVFYHLRHPLLMLERIASLAIEYLIVETHLDALDEQQPAMIFYPGSELANDHTNWWGPNPQCVAAMMRDVGCSHVEYTPHPTEQNRGIFHGRK